MTRNRGHKIRGVIERRDRSLDRNVTGRSKAAGRHLPAGGPILS